MQLRNCKTLSAFIAGGREIGSAYQPKGTQKELEVDCNKIRNSKSCNCTYEPCPRKGICCDCLDYHLKQQELPACCFSNDAERTYDRTFEHFAGLVHKNR